MDPAATNARAGSARTATGHDHQAEAEAVARSPGEDQKQTLAARVRGDTTPHPSVKRECRPEPNDPSDIGDTVCPAWLYSDRVPAG